mgnify:CR=1 FL=1|jgi:hypothetical protein
MYEKVFHSPYSYEWRQNRQSAVAPPVVNTLPGWFQRVSSPSLNGTIGVVVSRR